MALCAAISKVVVQIEIYGLAPTEQRVSRYYITLREYYSVFIEQQGNMDTCGIICQDFTVIALIRP